MDPCRCSTVEPSARVLVYSTRSLTVGMKFLDASSQKICQEIRPQSVMKIQGCQVDRKNTGSEPAWAYKHVFLK